MTASPFVALPKCIIHGREQCPTPRKLLPQSGFRSPAGIITPPLTQAIQKLGRPWVHWNHRFFEVSEYIQGGSLNDLGYIEENQIEILLEHNRPMFDTKMFFI